jgi:hypothetical protein
MRLRPPILLMALHRSLRTAASESDTAIRSVGRPDSAARRTSVSRSASGVAPVSGAAATRSGSMTRSPREYGRQALPEQVAGLGRPGAVHGLRRSRPARRGYVAAPAGWRPAGPSRTALPSSWPGTTRRRRSRKRTRCGMRRATRRAVRTPSRTAPAPRSARPWRGHRCGAAAVGRHRGFNARSRRGTDNGLGGSRLWTAEASVAWCGAGA